MAVCGGVAARGRRRARRMQTGQRRALGVESDGGDGGWRKRGRGRRLVSTSRRHGVAGEAPIGLRREGAPGRCGWPPGAALRPRTPATFRPSVSPSLSPRSHILPPPVAAPALLFV